MTLFETLASTLYVRLVPGDAQGWDGAPTETRAEALRLVRELLTLLRVPTEATIQAMADVVLRDGDIAEEWRAGIDAVLGEADAEKEPPVTEPPSALDAVYAERNQVVALLAILAREAGYRVGTAKTDIPGWEPEWQGCVYIDGPWGQISWHYHEREAPMFASLPAYDGTWDGHSTEEKYRRVRTWIARSQPIGRP